MMTTVREAVRIIRDAAMRRSLLEILQEATKDLREDGPSRPEPMLDDDDVKRELKRILKL